MKNNNKIADELADLYNAIYYIIGITYKHILPGVYKDEDMIYILLRANYHYLQLFDGVIPLFTNKITITREGFAIKDMSKALEHFISLLDMGGDLPGVELNHSEIISLKKAIMEYAAVKNTVNCDYRMYASNDGSLLFRQVLKTTGNYGAEVKKTLFNNLYGETDRFIPTIPEVDYSQEDKILFGEFYENEIAKF